jgi:hypothetical protein
MKRTAKSAMSKTTNPRRRFLWAMAEPPEGSIGIGTARNT